MPPVIARIAKPPMTPPTIAPTGVLLDFFLEKAGGGVRSALPGKPYTNFNDHSYVRDNI